VRRRTSGGAAELSALERRWADVFDAAGSKNWNKASAGVEEMTAAWETYGTSGMPKRVEPRMTRALAALAEAVGIAITDLDLAAVLGARYSGSTQRAVAIPSSEGFPCPLMPISSRSSAARCNFCLPSSIRPAIFVANPKSRSARAT
jgi:hypothetical protein